MPKNTPASGESSTRDTSLAAARKILDVTPIKGDHDTARQLLALCHNKATAPMIRYLLSQLFWDATQFYGLALPSNYTSKWRAYWPLLLAKLRTHGCLPTRINYTWQPTEEEEARLDAEEKADADARAIFDLLHNDALPVDTVNRLFDDVIEILDHAHPSADFEVFRIAWPRALAALDDENSEEARGDVEEIHARRTRDQIIARRSLRQTQATERSGSDGQ